MPDPNVTRWKQRGLIYIWHYKDNVRNFPGWHFTADNDGCTAMLELCALMQQAEYPARKTLQLSNPPDDVVQVVNPGSRWFSASSIEIRYPKDRVAADAWEMKSVDNKVRLIVGPRKLEELEDSIRELMEEGVGDYAICPENDSPDMELWFWKYRKG